MSSDSQVREYQQVFTILSVTKHWPETAITGKAAIQETTGTNDQDQCFAARAY